jgi:hypothetical protein
MQQLHAAGGWRLVASALFIVGVVLGQQARLPAHAQTPTLTPVVSLPIVMRGARLESLPPTATVAVSATPSATATATTTHTSSPTTTATQTSSPSPTIPGTQTATSTPQATASPTPPGTATPSPTPTEPGGSRLCSPGSNNTIAVTLRSCNAVVGGGQLIVVGEVRNGASQTLEDVRLTVTFYKPEGGVAGTGAFYLDENVVPGNSLSPFRRALTPPASYRFPGRLTIGVSSYSPTTRTPSRQPLQVQSQTSYTVAITSTIPTSYERYFVADVKNSTTTRLETLQAFLTTYDSDGEVLNVAVPRDVGNTSSLETILEPDELGAFKLRLPNGPLELLAPPTWTFRGAVRTEAAPTAPTVVGTPTIVETTEGITVTGQIRNDTNQTISLPSVVVTLYDEADDILDAILVTSFESLAPGAAASYETFFQANIVGWRRVEVEAQP